MLDMRAVRERTEEVRQNLRNRNMAVDVDALLHADEQARKMKSQLDQVRQDRNKNGQAFAKAQKEVGLTYDQLVARSAQGDVLTPFDRQLLAGWRQQFVEPGRTLKESEDACTTKVEQAEAQRDALLAQLPNFTHPDAPVGVDESANRVLAERGAKPALSFPPQDHVQLMERLDLVDFEGGAKVAGQKFYYLKNDAVLLELALVQFAVNLLREEGFTPFITPDLARQDILRGTGFNPRGESTQIYSIQDSDLSLVATAEITLAGLLAGEIIEAERLPLLYAGVSHCFRTEAGSAGRESRGLYRVHQFTKVEMFAFCVPEQSEALHQRLLAIEERIFQRLEIPYRVVDICTGDLGAPAYRKYDLEAWMPGRGQWGEVTSTSNCTDYQARRLNIRFRAKGQKGTQFLHMLNGTAIAVSRAIIALVENGQHADGSIHLPACLGLADIRPR